MTDMKTFSIYRFLLFFANPRSGCRMLAAALVLAAAALAGEPQPAPPGDAGPEEPHILLVNVGGALEEAEFAAGLDFVADFIRIRPRSATLDESVIERLVADPEAVSGLFDPGAVLVVMLEDDPAGHRFLQAPRSWAMVNFSGLLTGGVAEEVRIERVKKLLLKGLVHAAGGGHTPDPGCAMWHGGYTKEGLDRAAAHVSPHAFFSLHDTLRSLGLIRDRRGPPGAVPDR